MPKTIREVTVRYLETQGPVAACDVTLPEGTELVLVHNGTRSEYAVADVALLKRLTGNDHDPVYRYCFVPDEVVDVLQEQAFVPHAR
jgi:hypothetical protein